MNRRTRSRGGLLTLGVVAASVAMLLLVLGGDGRHVDPASDPRAASRGSPVEPRPLPRSLAAADACPGAGYLCAELVPDDGMVIRHWRDFEGTLVVHVPRPAFEAPGDAVRLQSAAAAGIRAWNGQPFPVRVDLRQPEGSHFAVRWTRSLGGTVVGTARTRWAEGEGLSVLAIDLATRDPYRPELGIDPDRVRLTAAHEMGHALGLPHSDSDRDVMYPMNSASALTARDYRTMEAVYALPDGVRILP